MIRKLRNLNNLQKGLLCLFIFNFFLNGFYRRTLELSYSSDEFQMGVGVVSLIGIFLFRSKKD